MKIILSPQRRDDTLEVSTSGDVITINGEKFDFTSLPDGATIDDVPCEFISGPVEREGGELVLTLILPHGDNASKNMTFPELITVTEDGPVQLPQQVIPEPVIEEDLDHLDLLGDEDGLDA